MRRFAAVASGLFAVLAGCGDDGNTRPLPDAPVPPDDAAPDAPPAVTSVNITAYARFYEDVPAMTPRAGAQVFALDAALTVVATATTDATGKATVELPNGGSITIVYPDFVESSTFSRAWVTTYLGVKPGDSLVVGDSFRENNGNGATLGAETLQWTTLANADGYDLSTACARYGSYVPPTESTQIDLFDDCATGPIVMTAYQGGNVIGSMYAPTVTHANGATHDLDALAGGWTTQAGTPNFISVLTGLPADAVVPWLGSRANYGVWSMTRYDTDVVPDTGMASAMTTVPATAPRKTAIAEVGRAKQNGRQFFAKTGISPVTIDTSTLPMFTAAPVADSKTRTVSWPMPVGTYDHAILQFRWTQFDGKNSRAMNWNVILPPGVSRLEADTLPPQLAMYLPQAAEFNLTNVRVVDLAEAASYDAARQLPEWRLSYPIESVHTGAQDGAAYADGGEGSDLWEPYNIPY